MSLTQIAEGRTLMWKFSVHELTGVVQSETTRSETEVTGHAYGGRTDGTTKIESKTTRYQTIYLKEDDGTEHAVELIDLVVPCREGHRLTLWRMGENLWFRVVNHDTGQDLTHGGLMKLMFPKGLYFTTGILLGLFMVDAGRSGIMYLFALLFAILIGLVIALIPCGTVAWLRARALHEAVAQKGTASTG